MKALFDTNILIDHLSGIAAARDLVRSVDDRAISIVTWIEVMSGADEASNARLRGLLAAFMVVDLDEAVAEMAASLRHQRRLKLSDAVIWASARVTGRTLLTRDVKDFPEADPGVRIPYKLN